MATGSSSHIPEIPPARPKPPRSYVYCLVAVVIWLIGWPIVFIITFPAATRETEVIHLLTVSGFAIWILSFLAFWAISSVLKESWPVLETILNGMECIFFLLSMLR